jgi:hypothetical protein
VDSKQQAKEDRKGIKEMKSIIAAAIRKDRVATTVATANADQLSLKKKIMARNTNDNKQVRSNNSNNSKKERRGDTERTSNQGRKEASGGSAETNNRGHRKGVDINRA